MGSDGDMIMDLTKCRSIINDQKQLYVGKCKVWQERECTLLVNSIAPILMQRAAVDTASNGNKLLLEKCLRRLRVSEDLIADSITNVESKVASAMASSAMSSELEMVDNKTSDSSKIRKLLDKHLKLYDVLKKEENERVQKFLQVCEEETRAFVVNSVLWNVLRLLVRLDTAKFTTKGRLSSQDKIARIIQKMEELVRKVDDKLQKDRLQGLPNSECSICFLGFSLKRKRACISPCGHANTCFDCAEREYKRTKTCPLCRCGMEKPVPLPGKLYF